MLVITRGYHQHSSTIGRTTPFQVERRADDFQRLKERALESLLRMKRAGELDRMAQVQLGVVEGALGIYGFTMV